MAAINDTYINKGKSHVKRAADLIIAKLGKETAAEIFGALADGLFAGARCAEWRDKRLVQEAIVAFIAELAMSDADRREADDAMPF